MTLGLAIVFIVGFAESALVKSFVDNLVLPITGVLISREDLERPLPSNPGPVVIGWGPLLSVLFSLE